VGFCSTGNVLCCCAPFVVCLKTAFLAFVVAVCVQRLGNQFLLAANGWLPSLSTHANVQKLL